MRRGCWEGYHAEGMRLSEWRVCEADGLSVVDVAIVEVELDAVLREHLGFDITQPHPSPRVEDQQSDGHKHPQVGRYQKKLLEWHAATLACIEDHEHLLCPE